MRLTTRMTLAALVVIGSIVGFAVKLAFMPARAPQVSLSSSQVQQMEANEWLAIQSAQSLQPAPLPLEVIDLAPSS